MLSGVIILLPSNFILQQVGLTGFEPVTPALSAQCSNQLSYRPVVKETSATEE